MDDNGETKTLAMSEAFKAKMAKDIKEAGDPDDPKGVFQRQSNPPPLAPRGFPPQAVSSRVR